MNNDSEKKFDRITFERQKFQVKNEFENIYFKLVCFYHAKTEEYDRTLTDLRDRHDTTSAYVTGIAARYSNSYAQNILRKIAKAGFSSKLFNEELHKHTGRHTAQWWINTYYFLLKNGVMEDVEKIMNKDNDKPTDLTLIKNPFL